jgi:predicted ATP-binding protein involved in virulence
MNLRIDRLDVRNFKGFAEQTFEFHPRFNLLIGPNASGKTSVLDALAVALGIWHVADEGVYGWRPIQTSEVRLEAVETQGLPSFEPQYPVSVAARGEIIGTAVDWTREIPNQRRTQTLNRGAAKALSLVRDLLRGAREAPDTILPVLAYYGAGRLWREMKEIKRKVSEPEPKGPPKPDHRKLSRLEAYRHCLDSRIRAAALREWLLRVDWASYQDRVEHPVYGAVKEAILGCLPGMRELFFDPKRMEPVVRANGQAWPYDLLSDGQRSVMAMVGDLAVKMMTANPHLGPQAIQETAGVVLIDELDLHLHPQWQRRIVADLKRTFPKIQFFCSTHSPQVVGEVPAEEVILLTRDGPQPAPQAEGMDSNWVLRNLMDSPDRDPEAVKALDVVNGLIKEGNHATAIKAIEKVSERYGGFEELDRARAKIERLNMLKK